MFEVPGVSSEKTSLKSILPETNRTPLKMDGWKTIVSFCYGATWQVRTVSFRVITLMSDSNRKRPGAWKTA